HREFYVKIKVHDTRNLATMGSTESPTRNITPISPFHNLAKNSGDPCQILEPARKTIETLEAQRIMAVLEDTIHRLELVMALQQVLQQLPRFRVMLGVELVDLCENHFTRQEQYWVLVGRLQKEDLRIACANRQSLIDKGNHGNLDESEVSQADGDGDDNQYWQKLKKDTSIGQQGLKYSLLDILRYFKKNPKAVEGILGLKLPCAPTYRAFLDYMEQVMSVMKERLLTFPKEEFRRKKMIIDIVTRERRTNATKERLQSKFIAAVKDKEIEAIPSNILIVLYIFLQISKCNAVIASLKNEVSMLDKVTHDQQRKTLADATKQCNVDAKISEGKKVKMRDEMILIKRELRDHRREHRSAETSMRKRTFKIGTEVYNWVQKYDADMGARQDEFDRINKLYEGEREDLTELEREFEVMETKYEAILEEKSQAVEAAKRQEEMIRLRNFAATRIQALWRGYGYRLGLKKRAQKKGKKGKK
ncbi:hypothetical protein QZH41_019106, partial [Actinostola sp. cb2023]